MTARTCSTCAWWVPFDPDDRGDIAEKVEPEARSRWGTCRLIGLPPYGEGVGREVLAFTKDGSDYRADLHTRDVFGCALWSLTAPEPEEPPAPARETRVWPRL